uniref:SCP domain-containing protein n=1 Tax=Mesocestoides corti TaxID=53468 RepID=A0A5K3EQZ9_MESCO
TGGSKPSIRNVIQSWFEEEKNYTYANNSCTGHCGGYKQMIWATSNEVGCAMKLCDRLESDMPKPVYLVACQYKPPGNICDEKPYEQGRRCSKCPVGFQCKRGQCSGK